MERNKSPTTTKTSIPITFPETYPFSLLSYLPDMQRAPGSFPGEHDPLFNAGLGETAVVFLVLILSSSTQTYFELLQSNLEIEGPERFVAFSGPAV